MFRQTTTSRFSLFLALVFLLAACAPRGGQPTLVAVLTQTLIPVPPTHTPLPPTATPSPPPRLRPSELIITPELTTQERLLQAAIAGIVAQDQISETLIQVPVQEAHRWRDAETLDCEPDMSEDRPPALIDGYEFVLLAANSVFVYHSDLEKVVRCSTTPLTEVDGDVLIRIDPVAGEMFRIAQEELAAQTDIAVRRITLEDMRIATWEDTSLGCSQEGQTYSAVHLNGYVLTLNAGDAAYTYHSDSERIILCETTD